MQTRTLGQGLTVSAIGMGCMGISHAEGAPMDDKAVVALLREAVDMGYTFFDTAETYGFPADPHHNEKMLGRAFAQNRDDVIIGTKFGVSFDFTADPNHPSLMLDSSPATIRAYVEGSLRRLQTDHIDLYTQHRIDPKVDPEVVAETMAELMQEGKVLHWGISMADEAYLRRAHAVCPVTAVQNMYQLLDADESLFPALEELGVGLVSCCPLAKGLLSGSYRKGQQFGPGDYRSHTVWFADETFDRIQALTALLAGIARRHDATPAQVSLAWMTGKHDWIVPIPGSRRADRLRENAGAGELTLSADELARIDALTQVIE